MSAPNAISVARLVRLVGTPDCPVIADLSTPEDHAADPRIIPGAFRHSHTNLPGLLARLAGRKAIMVCQKGRKLSQGAVSWLQAHGMAAEYLEGGLVGWAAHGAPLVPVAAVPFDEAGQTCWITRHRPKIDRIACSWLIRRFVDADARFLFVAPDEVMVAATLFGATPFDVADTHFGHRGEACTFDTMLDEFCLHTDALDRLALVIRAADTNRHEMHPVAAGLLAVSVGLSRQFRNDHQQLVAGMALYDGLYRWARDGQEEGHAWPEGQA